MFQLGTVAKDLHNAALLGLVVDAGIRADVGEHALTVDGQTRVHPCAVLMVAGTAVTQEPKAPADQVGDLRRAQQQRRLLAPDPAHELADRRGGIPRLRVAGVHHAAVGETALGGERRLAIHQRDLVTRLGKKIRRGGTDNPAADDQNVHVQPPETPHTTRPHRDLGQP